MRPAGREKLMRHLRQNRVRKARQAQVRRLAGARSSLAVGWGSTALMPDKSLNYKR
jgi:hypothetical protein